MKADITTNEEGDIAEENLFLNKESTTENKKENFNNTAESIEIDFTPKAKMIEEIEEKEPIHKSADEFIAKPIQNVNTESSIEAKEETPKFRVNIHTGTEDKTGQQSQNFVNQANAPKITTKVKSTAKTGPATTSLLLLSPVLALFFTRRKKMCV
jgi:hypothetical protein